MHALPCEVVCDPDGVQLVNNSKQSPIYSYFRGEDESCLHDCTRHQGPAEASSIMEFLGWHSLLDTLMDLHKDTDLGIDHIIKTRTQGRIDWAISDVISRDIGEAYDRSSLKHLIRYVCKRTIHFSKCDPELRAFFGNTPEGVIEYFNREVLGNGDLVLSVWMEIKKAQILSFFQDIW